MGIWKSLFQQRSPAQIAGRKASRAWQTIVDQTDEDLEVLTGLDLLNHARTEARKWLSSIHHGDLIFDPLSQARPETRYHEEFLDYVEAFVSVCSLPFDGDTQKTSLFIREEWKMDAQTRNVLAGMAFCLIGGWGSYFIVGTSVYLLDSMIFIIIACSLVVGAANGMIEKREESYG